MDNKKKLKTRALKGVINVGGSSVTFQVARGAGEPPDEHTLEPGDRVEIDAGYATPYRIAEDRDARPSTIELLTNKLVLPEDDPRAAPVRDRIEAKAKAKAGAKDKAA